MIIQWGTIWSNKISTDYVGGTVTLPLSFSTSSCYSIVATAMDDGDVIQFKNLTTSTAPYKIYDRLASYLAYDHAFWIAIGY